MGILGMASSQCCPDLNRLTTGNSVPYPDRGIIGTRSDQLLGVHVGDEATAPCGLLVTMVLGYQ